jgi:hypothetical protein
VKVPSGGSALRRLLNASKESLIAEERKLLQQVAQLLEEVAPQVRCATQLLRIDLKVNALGSTVSAAAAGGTAAGGGCAPGTLCNTAVTY